MIRRSAVQKSVGISWKRRARQRSSSRNWSFGDFCRHSCVRSSRYLLERLFPLCPCSPSPVPFFSPLYTLEDRARARASRFLVRASLPLPSFSTLPLYECTRLRASALSSSLIEYSPLYLRMLVEIYRRSRCPFRFNLLQRRRVFFFPLSCSP